MSGLASVQSRADPQSNLLLDDDTLDPKLEYRWVLNTPSQLARRSGQGYRLVSREDDGVKTLVPAEKAADDYIYNGDSVLMCCAKGTVRERRERNTRLASDRLETPVSQFKKEHQQSGARNSKVLTDEEGES
jgi:hypothetical protein